MYVVFQLMICLFAKIHFLYHALKQKMLKRHKIKSYERAEVKLYVL